MTLYSEDLFEGSLTIFTGLFGFNHLDTISGLPTVADKPTMVKGSDCIIFNTIY